ncbi:hypothetical protein [Streptomyces smyrnaeus]|uniref:hypothetical protein n=1 Tax=Streptomyces smyrnaeus TaxID=1387713 RepID=UPI003690BC29
MSISVSGPVPVARWSWLHLPSGSQHYGPAAGGRGEWTVIEALFESAHHLRVCNRWAR